MASFTSFPTPHVAQPIRYSQTCPRRSRPRRAETALLRTFHRYARRDQSLQRPLSHTHIVRDARKFRPSAKRLCRVFSHTHGASHRSRGSLSVPSSRPRRTESLNLRLNGATAFFQRHARHIPSFLRPFSRTHIVRDARKLPTSDETALPRLFAHTRRIPSFQRQLIRSVKPSIARRSPIPPSKRHY